MRSLLLITPVALLAAGAVAAQTPEATTDQIKKDGDPTVVGTTTNPVEGPDTPAEASTTTPDSPAASTMPGTAPMTATPSATGTPTRLYGTTGAGVTTRVTANAPVADTPENRARYGQPLSRAGKRTAPAGN